jgi:hypothetical protein
MSRNVLENNPDLPGENVERLVRIMERAFPGAMKGPNTVERGTAA